MTVSSKSLFHFTNSLNNIINILENDFRPHYSLEDFNVLFPKFEDSRYIVGIPMVSFCDLPLSKTIYHMKVYGEYGIGLTKEWGKNNGIAPILYSYPESILADYLRNIVIQLKDTRSGNPVIDFMHFIKPYVGNLWRSSGEIKNVTFYNEREWRYIPKVNDKILSKDNFLDDKTRNRVNTEIGLINILKYSPDDIRYIIVKSEDEILPLVRKIESIKGKYSYDIVKKLTTRIITSERIVEDF